MTTADQLQAALSASYRQAMEDIALKLRDEGEAGVREWLINNGDAGTRAIVQSLQSIETEGS